MRFRRAIAQAAALSVLAIVSGGVFNAFWANGLNPFADRAEVPVLEGEADSTAAGDQDGIRYIGIDEFRKMIHDGRIIIDARARQAYVAGHIPGALLCDYYDMGRCLDVVMPMLNPFENIGIYCSGPSCDDAEMLAKELYELGYKKLSVFKGGMEAWEASGLPLEEGMPEVMR